MLSDWFWHMFFVFVWGVVFSFKTRPLGTQKPSLPVSLGSLVIKAFERGDLKCFLEGFLVCCGNWRSLHVYLLWAASSAYEIRVETFPSVTLQ